MSLPIFPHTHVNRGPRCAMCLQNVPSRRHVETDECDPVCISGHGTRGMGAPVTHGHLHWECECGYTWATQTATQSGHDPDQQ